MLAGITFAKRSLVRGNATYRSVLLLLGYKVMGHGHDANLIALLCPPPNTDFHAVERGVQPAGSTSTGSDR